MKRLTMALVLAALAAAPPAAGADDDVCRQIGATAKLPELSEASGVAASRRTPGIVWSHNDSGQPVLYALDATGTLRGRVRIPNARVENWEDISAGACSGRPCLYVADIGDNGKRRTHIVVYRIVEPLPQDSTSAPAEIFSAVYPDGPHDAEALFVTAAGAFVVTKEDRAAVYRLPRPMRAGIEMRLEKTADLPLARVTAAETSPDGRWVAIRTHDELSFYRAADLAGKPSPSAAFTQSLRALDEPQGEGVAFGDDDAIYLAGEGRQAGTFNVLRCTLR